MKLSICLVTQGRQNYLKEALTSYERFLESGDVNVIILDNGADNYSKQILNKWCVKNKSSTKYVLNATNEQVGTPFFWNKIKALDPDWVIFPGDDDVLKFDIFEEFKCALKKNEELIAFGTSVEVINSDGKSTGEIRVPPIYDLTSKPEVLAQSLYEPPFLWPSLFFKFEAIQNNVPMSRYVFDWWVGLQLILNGSTECTKSVGLKYRVHDQQESFQTPMRRKFFEGFNLLADVISSQVFERELIRLTNSDRLKLLEICAKRKPLYAQIEYSIPILRILADKVSSKNLSGEYINEIYNNFLFGLGIYMKTGDLNNIYIKSDIPSVTADGNFSVRFEENICQLIDSSKDFFNKKSSHVVTLACKHSRYSKDSTYIKCHKLANLTGRQVADAILLAINADLEKNDKLNFVTTPFEKFLILTYRKSRNFLPKFLSRQILKLKTLTHSQ